MNRNFPPSPAFAAMAQTLASQIADYECSPVDEKLCEIFSETEKALFRKPADCVGDLMLKLEILAEIGQHTVIDDEEWQAIARDVQRLNGPGMSFNPEAWLRRWTHRGGGYVCTDSGLSFLATGEHPGQLRLLLKELERAQGHQAVADLIDARDVMEGAGA